MCKNFFKWITNSCRRSYVGFSLKKQPICHVPYIYTLKKSNATRFNRLYQFAYGFVFIMLGIIWKLGYLSFHWYNCFAGTWAGRLNWVQCQKRYVGKLDHNFNRWYQFDYEIIFIMFYLKACLFVFPLVYHLLWLPGRNVRQVTILGAISLSTTTYQVIFYDFILICYISISADY